MKFIYIFCITILFTLRLSAQDFVITNQDDVIRGTIKGTDYFSVFISQNDKKDLIFSANDVKNFFWNGDSFVSKGFAGKKNLEYRFVKVLEIGKVNLYTFGGGTLIPVSKEKNVKFRPSISIGTGTSMGMGGGYGGLGRAGLGGGIGFGGGRGNNYQEEKPAGAPAIRYYIEKPGTGPMQEIQIKAITDPEQKIAVRSILLQKLGDVSDLKTKIESNSDLNSRDVLNWVIEYNSLKQ